MRCRDDVCGLPLNSSVRDDPLSGYPFETLFVSSRQRAYSESPRGVRSRMRSWGSNHPRNGRMNRGGPQIATFPAARESGVPGMWPAPKRKSEIIVTFEHHRGNMQARHVEPCDHFVRLGLGTRHHKLFHRPVPRGRRGPSGCRVFHLRKWLWRRRSN